MNNAKKNMFILVVPITLLIVVFALIFWNSFNANQTNSRQQSSQEITPVPLGKPNPGPPSEGPTLGTENARIDPGTTTIADIQIQLGDPITKSFKNNHFYLSYSEGSSNSENFTVQSDSRGVVQYIFFPVLNSDPSDYQNATEGFSQPDLILNDPNSSRKWYVFLSKGSAAESDLQPSYIYNILYFKPGINSTIFLNTIAKDRDLQP